jgi:metallo-beta-lactamase family protein
MDIKLTFLGASQNVTGSRYQLEVNNKRILIDCGLYQERKFADRNWDPFPTDPGTFDCILLTHAHLDHCGLLPKFVAEGFLGKIYTTSASAALAKIITQDSAKIMAQDARFKAKRHKKQNKKGKHPYKPLYDIEDALKCASLFAPVKYHQTTEIAEGITISFAPTGHILGAASILVTITQNGETRTILFSGDVGRWDVPILKDPYLHESADYMLIESTYGDSTHEDNSHIQGKLADVINETHKAGGNIVIPTFAVERSQEILYYLNELRIEKKIPHLMTILDSPMAIKATKVFQNNPQMFDEEMTEYMKKQQSPFNFSELQMTQTASESKTINGISGTAIIMAGSGMCTGGRIKHHLVNNISRKESTILFVGYQADGTLGRIILNGIKEIRLFGQKFPVKARIERIHGFSGHADQGELLRYIEKFKQPPKTTFIVHGEKNVAKKFAKCLTDKKGWQCVVPQYQETVTLT